ncbi:MAG TPA: hypothetical protein VGS19_20645 [Streptosporangiaceae bacterium]|nr:hypothetical protein [Streptosporangiaceae bacterium]
MRGGILITSLNGRQPCRGVAGHHSSTAVCRYHARDATRALANPRLSLA